MATHPKTSKSACDCQVAQRQNDLVDLEQFSFQTTLPDNRAQGADVNFFVIGHDDGYRFSVGYSLHRDVAAAPPHLGETMLFQQLHNVCAGQATELTQSALPTG